MGLIDVENGWKEYGSKADSKVVFNGLNLSVQKGSIYALMGASGCGKTTLIETLVGLKQLDSGTIALFGDHVGKNNMKIGYMPQATALIQEFSISETVNFFGTIYGMKKDDIESRLNFLQTLLDLPDTDQIVGTCSGGQQRRVSFAIALVHDPELLILDEPTVGVDPLLRTRIWDFLIDLTKKKNSTVLITTHYIEEAKQSTHVGLMRKGLLVAEDTPLNLLTTFGTNSLEEAFLKLSEQQESDIKSYGRVYRKTTSNESRQPTKTRKVRNAGTANANKLRALITKNTTQLVRNPGIIIFALLVPLMGILCLHASVGGKIEGLTIGIFNEEIAFRECSNQTLKTFDVSIDSCDVRKISCRFMSEINDRVAIKRHFSTWTEARTAAKRAEVIGLIHFAFNFTEAFLPLKYWTDFDEHDNNGAIEVHLDMTDLNTVTYIQRNIYNAYRRFIRQLMLDCDRSEKAWNLPMVFETYNGDLEDEFTNAISPGFLFTSLYTLASYLTSMVLVEERRSGIWNRVITAGVKPQHFFFSHLFTGCCLMLLQCLEFVIYSYVVATNSEQLDRAIVVIALLLLTGLGGVLYGLLISATTDNVVVASCFSLVLCFPWVTLAGIIWPIEGSPPVLQFFAKLLPFTEASRSYKSLLFTNFALSSAQIYMGFIVNGCWVIGLAALCLWMITKSQSTSRIY